MRTRAVLLSLVWAATLVASAGRASATDCSGLYSSCVNSDTLWPHAGPSRFVAIGSTETVEPGQVGFGLVSSYLSRPILLGTATPGPGGTRQYAVDNQVNGTFLWAYGVTDALELDLAVPLTFVQDGAGLTPLTGGNGLKDTAVRDLRFGFTYALLPHSRVAPTARAESFGLAARLEVSAPTGDEAQLAGEGSGVFVPSVTADWRRGRFFVGGEVGARLRPTVDLQGARIGPQLVTELGAGFDILPRELLTAIVEAWALPGFAQQETLSSSYPGVFAATPNGTYLAPAEWQLSARTAPLSRGDFSIQLGGGGPLPITNGALTTPRFRFTLGVRWAPTGRPAPATAAATAATAGGAAMAPAAPPPVVDLHLASARDVCRSDPDLVDGFKDTDGCPDEDQDKDGIDDRLDRCPMVPEDFVGLTDGCPDKP